MDYQSHVLDWEEFKDLQLSFLKASVPEIETPTDMAIPAALHIAAAEHGLRHVISGGNYATEGILPARWHYNAKDRQVPQSHPEATRAARAEDVPDVWFRNGGVLQVRRGIRIAYLLNHVPYSRQDAIEVLEKQLGWTPYGGKHHESRITGFVQSYVLPTKFGIDYRKATLSTQICAGEITREEDPVKFKLTINKYLADSHEETIALKIDPEIRAAKHNPHSCCCASD